MSMYPPFLTDLEEGCMLFLFVCSMVYIIDDELPVAPM